MGRRDDRLAATRRGARGATPALPSGSRLNETTPRRPGTNRAAVPARTAPANSAPPRGLGFRGGEFLLVDREGVVADDAGVPLAVAARAAEHDDVGGRDGGPPDVETSRRQQTPRPVTAGARTGHHVVRQHGTTSVAYLARPESRTPRREMVKWLS